MGYESIVIRNEEHGVRWVCLNRPDRMNALTPAAVLEFTSALQEAEEDPDVRVIVVTGMGKGFCAGADFSPGALDHARERRTSATERYSGRTGFQALTRTVRGLTKPTIAAVNGVAVGAGFDLALACDLRVGCEKSRFQVAFLKRGIVPGTGGLYLLPQIIGLSRALELVYTTNFLEGEEANRWGVLNRYVPFEKLEEATSQLAQQIAKGPPIAQSLSKTIMLKVVDTMMDIAYAHTAAASAIVGATEDAAEGRRAFVEKREPQFKGK